MGPKKCRLAQQPSMSLPLATDWPCLRLAPSWPTSTQSWELAWFILGPLGCHGGQPWAILALSWVISGPSWSPCGQSWAILGSSNFKWTWGGVLSCTTEPQNTQHMSSCSHVTSLWFPRYESLLPTLRGKPPCAPAFAPPHALQ